MHPDLQKAIGQLKAENYTCVFCKGNTVYTSYDRGIAPLLKQYEKNTLLSDFYVADKVVGKGAAFMYVLLGIRELYAEILSESAKAVLTEYGIPVYAGSVVNRILNREKTGFCPIESAVLQITDPTEALFAIQQTLKELKK